MKSKIERYGFSKAVVDRVRSICDVIDQGDGKSLEKNIANLALDICNQLQQGLMLPKEGDDHFTLLYLFLSDHYPELRLGEEVRNLLFEGNTLHDLGAEYGPKIEFIRTLAEEILQRQ